MCVCVHLLPNTYIMISHWNVYIVFWMWEAVKTQKPWIIVHLFSLFNHTDWFVRDFRLFIWLIAGSNKVKLFYSFSSLRTINIWQCKKIKISMYLFLSKGSHSCAVVVSLPFVVSLALLSTINCFEPHFYYLRDF